MNCFLGKCKVFEIFLWLCCCRSRKLLKVKAETNNDNSNGNSNNSNNNNNNNSIPITTRIKNCRNNNKEIASFFPSLSVTLIFPSFVAFHFSFSSVSFAFFFFFGVNPAYFSLFGGIEKKNLEKPLSI